MYGKVKNIWDIKANGGGSSIDTENFASKNKANTFTNKNIFENTGNVISIKTTDDQAFGIEFKNSSDQAVAYVGGTSDNKAYLYSANDMKIETPNHNIDLNPGSGDVYVNTSKNWNQQQDNSVVRLRDIKWKKIFDYSSVVAPTNSWNTTSWNWNLSGINNQGFHEFILAISFADHVLTTLHAQVIWKSGLTESRSEIVFAEKNGRIYYFQFVIKNDGKLYIYNKHDNAGNNGTISWARAWVKRDVSFPSKYNSLW